MGYEPNMSSDPNYEKFSDNDIKILVKIFNKSVQELLAYKQKQPEDKYFQ